MSLPDVRNLFIFSVALFVVTKTVRWAYLNHRSRRQGLLLSASVANTLGLPPASVRVSLRHEWLQPSRVQIGVLVDGKPHEDAFEVTLGILATVVRKLNEKQGRPS